MSAALPLLVSVVEPRLNDAARRWLRDAAATDSVDQLLTAYTAASRRAGKMSLTPTAEARQAIGHQAPGVTLERWTVADAARLVLLLGAAERLTPDAFMAAAIECYHRGAALEQESWLRGLPLLPGSERFLDTAIDACRTNILPVFEAIACENPYPARHFPQPAFNQLVLKTMFMGVALARVNGLAGRLNAELSRMATDFAAERRAAGRPVPPDLALALAN